MKSRNPIARVVKGIRNHVIPDKRAKAAAKEEVKYFMCDMLPGYGDEDYFTCNETPEVEMDYGMPHGDGRELV